MRPAMADDPTYRKAVQALSLLSAAQRWGELEGEARRAATAYPGSSTVHAFAAHALRQLGQLEEGTRGRCAPRRWIRATCSPSTG